MAPASTLPRTLARVAVPHHALRPAAAAAAAAASLPLRPPQHRTVTNSTRPDYIPSFRSISRDAISAQKQPGGWIPALMHASGEVKFTIIRVPPGTEVPTHLHSAAWDYFFPLSGQGRISVYPRRVESDADTDEQHYEMRKDTFLAVPPGDTHVVRNKLEREEFVYLLAQAPRGSYDFVSVEDVQKRV